MKRFLGIELGHYRVKLAYMEQGILKNYISERTQTDFHADKRLYAEQIRKLLAVHEIHCKNTVFVLPQEKTYVKRVRLPLLTKEQLNLNLPYEFVDYIGEQTELYQFDYAVLERSSRHLDLLAAACKKELCTELQSFAKLAGLRLTGLVPAVIGLERLLNRNNDRKQDFVIVDLGFRALRIHFFRQGFYDTTRILEPGCEEMEQLCKKEEENTELFLQCCQTIAVQIMRVLNFYSFNHMDNTLDTLYYCGGGARYPKLLAAMDRAVEIPVKSLAVLFPELNLNEIGITEDCLDSPQTIGVLLT